MTMIEIKIKKSKISDNYLLYLNNSEKEYLYDEVMTETQAKSLKEYTMKYLDKNPILSLDFFTSCRLRETIRLKKITDEKKKYELAKKGRR